MLQVTHDQKRLLIAGMREKVRKVLYDLGITQEIGIGNFLPTLPEAISYALAITKEEIEQTYLGGYLFDVYIPGCPRRPEALLHGILLAVGRNDGTSIEFSNTRLVL